MLYDAWMRGISPKEFRESRMSDIMTVSMLKNAFDEKKMREAEVRKMTAQMKRRW